MNDTFELKYYGIDIRTRKSKRLREKAVGFQVGSYLREKGCGGWSMCMACCRTTTFETVG